MCSSTFPNSLESVFGTAYIKAVLSLLLTLFYHVLTNHDLQIIFTGISPANFTHIPFCLIPIVFRGILVDEPPVILWVVCIASSLWHLLLLSLMLYLLSHLYYQLLPSIIAPPAFFWPQISTHTHGQETSYSLAFSSFLFLFLFSFSLYLCLHFLLFFIFFIPFFHLRGLSSPDHNYLRNTLIKTIFHRFLPLPFVHFSFFFFCTSPSSSLYLPPDLFQILRWSFVSVCHGLLTRQDKM